MILLQILDEGKITDSQGKLAVIVCRVGTLTGCLCRYRSQG